MQLSSILKKTTSVGELNVNLSSIWAQNCKLLLIISNIWLLFHMLLIDHTFIKKWGVLEKIGDDQKNIAAGYLQVDLAIISSAELPTPATLTTHNDDIIEE